jgi:hypothetical protein
MKVLPKFMITGLLLLLLAALVSPTVKAQSNWWEGKWTVTPPKHAPVSWTLNANGTANESGGGFVDGSGKYTVSGSSLTIKFKYADFTTGAQHPAQYIFSMQDDHLSGVGTFYADGKALDGDARIAKAK